MPLTTGQRLGPYEILAPIGAGGMGEVYKARDTRLDRTVAVKVLSSHIATNTTLRQRFEREARAVSSLNHPNICTLHDIGNQDGMDYLVMEHLEGETLAQRLERGPLALDELFRCAYDVADALDRAHRSGLMHRDLKPGNIMLTRSGAKLLDFGLAKGVGSGAAPSNMTVSPTMTSPLTAEGSIVGTFQYMAPEQLEGKDADPRSDLFALGAVIYEMATGQRAFTGKTQASLIASILKDEPRPILEVQAMNPPALDRLVRQCLAKDPDDRWQSAGDIKRELKWISQSGSQSGAPVVTAAPVAAAPRRGLAALPWVAALLLAAGAFAAAGLLRPSAPPPVVMRSSLMLPPDTNLVQGDTSLALSPDGTRLAFLAAGADATQRIWIRPIDSLAAQPLAGTEGATYPFWSPDGQQIGFFADRKLRKVPAAGGTVVAICEAEDGRGASWSQAGTIVFSPAPYGQLMQVSASGGTPVPVTTVATDGTSHRVPHFMPDGKHLLFFSFGSTQDDSDSGIYSLEIDSKKVTLVAHENSEGIYVEPGYLVFARDENLMAQPFDASSMTTRGEAVPIAEKVSFNAFRYTGAYTVSPSGLLIYQTGRALQKSQLTWFDANGTRGAAVAEPANVLSSVRALSPTGQRAAVVLDAGDRVADLWIYDLVRGVGTRFTFGTTAITSPVWSPDGSRIAFSDGVGKLAIKAADGASAQQVLVAEEGKARLVPSSFSPDGSLVAYRKLGPKSRMDIWIATVNGERKPYPFLVTPANETEAVFSPDGRWLAYLSDESGRNELFVVPFPGPGGKWQISSGGASAGYYLGDGREIIYITPERKLIGVPLTATGPNLEIGASRPLFGGKPMPVSQGWSITRDGGRYLAAVPLSESAAPPLTLVTNWPAELAAR